jgi:hypothetical protein
VFMDPYEHHYVLLLADQVLLQHEY